MKNTTEFSKENENKGQHEHIEGKVVVIADARRTDHTFRRQQMHLCWIADDAQAITLFFKPHPSGTRNNHLLNIHLLAKRNKEKETLPNNKAFKVNYLKASEVNS